MKNLNSVMSWKVLLAGALAIASFQVPLTLAADGAKLVSQKKVSTREGTETELSDADVADLQQWLKGMKNDLKNLVDKVKETQGAAAKRSLIIPAIGKIVDDSGSKETELLARYTLNRALEINDVMGANPSPLELNILVDYLSSSLTQASDLALEDEAYLAAIHGTQKDLKSMVDFGVENLKSVNAVANQIISASIEYKLIRMNLGWLGNDLNTKRNLDRALYAAEIKQIKELLDKYPADPAGSDAEILRSVRALQREISEKIIPAIEAKLGHGVVVSWAPYISPQDGWQVVGQENGKNVMKDLKTGLTWYRAHDEKMNQYDAEKKCKELGQRLPTKEEFEQAEADGVRKAFSDFSGRRFWSSSLYPGSSNSAYDFYGDDGYIYNYYRDINNDSVRCVGR